ncbi:MAG TPA: YciI family protein [Polyangiaceae bacterium]|nr:YciI family protein [Polyangiaceae bacterium]
MRFMIQLWSREDTDLRRRPDPRLIAAMARYYEELTDAGVLRVAEGLLPSLRGARIVSSHGERVVSEGPFAETGRLTAAILIIQVRSKAEALAWAERCPLADGDLLELRELYEPPYVALESASRWEAWPEIGGSKIAPQRPPTGRLDDLN